MPGWRRSKRRDTDHRNKISGRRNFHATYQGFEAFVRIADGEIIAGSLPNKAVRIVRQWALDHREALMANWARGEALEPMELVPERTRMIKIVAIGQIGDGPELALTFNDGAQASWSATDLIARNTVLTRPLADPDYFARCFIEGGALAWPNGLELSPAALYLSLGEAGVLKRKAA